MKNAMLFTVVAGLLEKEGRPVGEERQATVDRIAERVTQNIRGGSGD